MRRGRRIVRGAETAGGLTRPDLWKGTHVLRGMHRHMKYDTVIFDLDGTLTDSKEGIVNSIRYALEKVSVPCPPEETLSFFLGPPLAESFMRYCGMDERQAVLATEYYRERYVPRGLLENAVYPGIRHLLKQLKRRGIFVGLATGKPLNATERILRHFRLYEYFDALSCPALSDLHADKAVLIGRVLDRRPESGEKRVLMVGDIDGDVLGGKKAGTDTCAALWGYGRKDALLGAGPDYAFSSPWELCSLLLDEQRPPRGGFVSMEGLDGCGKTTQQRLLGQRLTRFGFDPLLTREPGGCPLAESIRALLLTREDTGMSPETEALLFAAARAQHLKDTILPALESGKTVLCDRYIDSSLVYQGCGRGLGMDWIRQINRPALRGGMPDLTLYLQMDAAEALKRRGAVSSPDRIERAGDAFFRKNREAFDTLAREERRFAVIDAAGAPDEVADRIFRAVFPVLDALC